MCVTRFRILGFLPGKQEKQDICSVIFHHIIHLLRATYNCTKRYQPKIVNLDSYRDVYLNYNETNSSDELQKGFSAIELSTKIM